MTTPQRRMSQGGALIEARRMLGPLGHVRRTAEAQASGLVKVVCVVGTFSPEGLFDEQGRGEWWDTALEAARPKAQMEVAVAA